MLVETIDKLSIVNYCKVFAFHTSRAACRKRNIHQIKLKEKKKSKSSVISTPPPPSHNDNVKANPPPPPAPELFEFQ